MCRLSRNSGAWTSWNPKCLSRPVVGKLYLTDRNAQVSVEQQATQTIQKILLRSVEWAACLAVVCTFSNKPTICTPKTVRSIYLKSLNRSVCLNGRVQSSVCSIAPAVRLMSDLERRQLHFALVNIQKVMRAIFFIIVILHYILSYYSFICLFINLLINKTNISSVT
jgi:hypothetical protein